MRYLGMSFADMLADIETQVRAHHHGAPLALDLEPGAEWQTRVLIIGIGTIRLLAANAMRRLMEALAGTCVVGAPSTRSPAGSPVCWWLQRPIRPLAGKSLCRTGSGHAICP